MITNGAKCVVMHEPDWESLGLREKRGAADALRPDIQVSGCSVGLDLACICSPFAQRLAKQGSNADAQRSEDCYQRNIHRLHAALLNEEEGKELDGHACIVIRQNPVGAPGI